jgi:hypothetical protein
MASLVALALAPAPAGAPRTVLDECPLGMSSPCCPASIIGHSPGGKLGTHSRYAHDMLMKS